MPNIVRSARGDMVDFGVLRIKHAQEEASLTKTAKPTKSLVRNENFIAERQAAAKAVAESKEALSVAMEETAPVQEPIRKITKKDNKNA